MITYVGGKTKQANHIIDHFPKDYEELHYVEVFGGSGAILFAKEKSYAETYNDINGDLVNLFKCVRDHPQELEDRGRWVLYSREMWKDAYIKTFKTREFIDDIDRALQTAILFNQSYSGLGNSWSYSTKSRMSNSWASFYDKLYQYSNRLKHVQIENLSFDELIPKYDHEDAFMYVDPPYLPLNVPRVDQYYNVKFTMEMHEGLSKLLMSSKSKWLLSYYHHPILDEWYEGCTFIYKEFSKSSYRHDLSHDGKKPKAIELLITNIDESELVKYSPSTSSLHQWFE
jgi:DNA adenine methylase